MNTDMLPLVLHLVKAQLKPVNTVMTRLAPQKCHFAR